MHRSESPPHLKPAAGFTLPAILVVVGALLILAVGILLVVGIERNTARSFADRQRAELAASAALEDVRGILNREAANDDFLVIQSTTKEPLDEGFENAPYLFLARGEKDPTDSDKVRFRYIPLFSRESGLSPLPESPELTPPAVDATGGELNVEFTARPDLDRVQAGWLPIKDAKERTVARYAYWVEDLQGKLDPTLVGNLDGTAETHVREPYPFPAPGVDDPATGEKDQPALNQVNLHAIDPTNGQSDLGRTLIRNRDLLISPGSTLAAAGIDPPLTRLKEKSADAKAGQLADPKARAAETDLVAGLRPYFERPVIPFTPGISPQVAGLPRLNLNALLGKPPDDAVAEMAEFIRAALPMFDNRKGGFPTTEDYLKTLAANAIDYADKDSKPTIAANSHRGLDACPLLSETALQVNYEGISNLNGRKILKFRFKLYAELFNPTSQPVTKGKARLSYEVAIPMDGIGSGTGDIPFDDPSLLGNPVHSTHDLELINNRYWTREIELSLAPNEYQCHTFADVSYRIDVGPASVFIAGTTPFSLLEDRGKSGSSLMWNGDIADRVERIVRQEGLVATSQGGGFKVGTQKTITKAAVAGHTYDNFFPSMYYNMGDARINYYLRTAPLAENAYPQNISPNRRNIRVNIYTSDGATKPKVYGRVLPSEWPDGGHNSAVGSWAPGTDDKTDMSDPRFAFPYTADLKFSAPQQISNRGFFHSATELGRVFDPIMHTPTLAGGATGAFLQSGSLSSDSWPDVTTAQPSKFYGGGNTLRIGRPEHPAFSLSADSGLHAAHLLDLFHTGVRQPTDTAGREGALTRIEGAVNLNTASRDVLRALAAGNLVMDPVLAKRTSKTHSNFKPPTTSLTLSSPTTTVEGDRIADAILLRRPFSGAAGLASAKDKDGKTAFGNKALYKENTEIEWTDSAAEETFARVYESTTLRSRNFRVWVVAQAITPTSGPGTAPEVLSEVRKVFNVFADPGERASDGAILPEKFKTTIIHANDF